MIRKGEQTSLGHSGACFTLLLCTCTCAFVRVADGTNDKRKYCDKVLHMGLACTIL